MENIVRPGGQVQQLTVIDALPNTNGINSDRHRLDFLGSLHRLPSFVRTAIGDDNEDVSNSISAARLLRERVLSDVVECDPSVCPPATVTGPADSFHDVMFVAVITQVELATGIRRECYQSNTNDGRRDVGIGDKLFHEVELFLKLVLSETSGTIKQKDHISRMTTGRI